MKTNPYKSPRIFREREDVPQYSAETQEKLAVIQETQQSLRQLLQSIQNVTTLTAAYELGKQMGSNRSWLLLNASFANEYPKEPDKTALLTAVAECYQVYKQIEAVMQKCK
ncbi:MAG: hypothetical protein KC680_04115 [Candidatus Peregrinibacteria bacterium]|nr:hypothetical protein [Candidatus Peregrinibacteria bacterium]MCB9808281.1 hypothetical protein [Candidatus Peribacteria bacterium]